ncbi:MAG: 2-dehydropantoate 2-reductase, partial [Leptospira sp.]|nr:2-dehydropantoate 2-reductase [Leptospira sp.]
RSGKVVPQIAPFVLCLPDFMFFRIASNMIKIDPLARSSMWEDLNKGRLTEIDYINGEIVKLGKKLFIETPINSKIIEMIRIAEKNKSGSPMLNSKEMGSRLGIHF